MRRWLVPLAALTVAGAVGTTAGLALGGPGRGPKPVAAAPSPPAAGSTPRGAAAPPISPSSSPAARSAGAAAARPRGPEPTRFRSPSPSQPVPGPARDGDVDGDGRIDAMSLRMRAGTPSLIARLTSAGTQEVPFAGPDDGGTPLVLGTTDVDGDGHGEVFVRFQQGASTSFATLFRFVGGRLRLVTVGGAQAVLGYGGAVTHADHWSCARGRIITWTGDSSDGATFVGPETTYRFAAATLVRVRTRQRTVDPGHPPRTGCGALDY